ncbi:MFS transporter [Natronosporangium hydrolyticum]|uniref:MFS transporter n=1 Tax=Natronosporangium hydrolyticum TaxID=2811111 RepID=A0A895YI95_9ACTN|nr:MFS transporter [Natronosporangium hydrolyticum]QSB15745.1 MFS transporter [Natronosporangium hydrolyticum]
MPLLLLAYLGFISLGLPDGMLGVAWPYMRVDFDRPAGAIGFVLLVLTAGYLLSSVSAGFMLARFGVGRLLATSTGLAATGLLGFAAAPGLVPMVLVAGLLGASAGAIDAGLNAYAARHFGARHMNWLHASFSFGATLGPLVVTAAVAVGLAWRGGYVAVAVGQVALAVAFALTVRAWRDRAADRVEQGRPPAPATAGPALPPATARSIRRPPPLVATLRQAGTWLGAGAFAVGVAIEAGAGLWAYTLLTEVDGVSGQLAGVAVSAYWGSLFVGRLLVGVVVERIGVHRVLVGSVTVIVLGAAVVALPGAAPATVTGLVLIGLGVAPIFPLLMLTTARRVGESHSDRVVGMQVAAGTLGGAAAPALIGVLIDLWSAAVLGPSLLVFGALLGALYLWAHRRSAGGEAGEPAGSELSGPPDQRSAAGTEP